MNKKSNFHGIMLALLMFTLVLALFTSKPETTGLVVKEIGNDLDNNIGNDKENNIGVSCIGSIEHNSCSNTKPLYCDNGQLVYNCYECGCVEGETCSEYGVCIPIETCADGSIYGECSTGLKGNFCDDGKLISDCGLCGCEEDEVCSNNKCISS